MIDFDLPTTDDIPDSKHCPQCGARHWLNYYATEDEEIGLACGVCGIHYRDEEATQGKFRDEGGQTHEAQLSPPTG